MEIQDPIHGAIEIAPGEVKVMDSMVFQRLRSIKQLGFSEYSFPGATHNRYIHSVGVCHLAGKLFDSIFRHYKFSKNENRERFRQIVRLGALLHDIGHGPLSHTTEEVMPALRDLNVTAYKNLRTDIPIGSRSHDEDRRADHEDFTIKLITESQLSEIIRANWADIEPLHVAALVDKTLEVDPEVFNDEGINFRTILSQIVSSEMDADRMDYLERDAYYCGTNYGRVELNWLIANATYNQVGDQLFLALNRRALYTFDDFLLARHHMHLMVYFHHKSIIYEQTLINYLTSEDCNYFLPSDVDEYLKFNDFGLYEHLATQSNKWAQMVAQRSPYKMVFELHSTQAEDRIKKMKAFLEGQGIPLMTASSSARLSKYHSANQVEKVFPIYVVDQYDHLAKPYQIEESTQIFQKYEETRRIERIYVDRNYYSKARELIFDHKL
ncbi:MAG: HD domain-containing protein [Bdellovibrionales bacterium]|nr:HD domain-containing protein [Bdellovibrionales bacterium]